MGCFAGGECLKRQCSSYNNSKWVLRKCHGKRFVIVIDLENTDLSNAINRIICTIATKYIQFAFVP